MDGIAVSDVTVTYRNGQTALWDASFEIPRGTITALVGVNGAGKSTLFKAIMGFVPAARGDIRLLGRTVKEALRENLVAYVPQAEEVDWAFPVLVEDVVMMGRYGHMGFLRRTRPADRAAVDEALSRVVVDFSGRPGLHMDVPFKSGMVGGFDTQLAYEFFQGFANHALVTLHIDNLKGQNAHHQAETVFKAFGRALRMALAIDPRAAGVIPSTKGSL